MKLNKSDEVKLQILRCLSKEGCYINGLKKKTGLVNYSSLKRSVAFLHCLGLVSVEEHHKGNRKYNWVSITKLGREALRYLDAYSRRCYPNA